LPPAVEVVIYDDVSPQIDEILSTIKPFLSKNPGFKLVINKTNLGYDKNLLNAILTASGEYVFLISDDDYVEFGTLNSVLDGLTLNPHPLSFVRFSELKSILSWAPPAFGSGRRDFGRETYFDSLAIFTNGSFLYNSILFSGLIFKKSEVIKIKEKLSPFLKSIYIQVAIFCLLAAKFGAKFKDGPGVVACGDGENGFGSNNGSIDNDREDLIDRSSIHSNLKFNRRLINVVEMLSADFGVTFMKVFFDEFNFRNFSGMRYARKMGRLDLIKYWNELGEVTKYRSIYHWIVFFIMLILPIAINSFLVDLSYKVSTIIRPGR
jgi:glycosyltransferase involved in cell wall biosynthesis